MEELLIFILGCGNRKTKENNKKFLYDTGTGTFYSKRKSLIKLICTFSSITAFISALICISWIRIRVLYAYSGSRRPLIMRTRIRNLPNVDPPPPTPANQTTMVAHKKCTILHSVVESFHFGPAPAPALVLLSTICC